MSDQGEQAIERLREIWTPNQEVYEVSGDLGPQTPLDSLIRHLLHAIVQQKGAPIQVNMDELNTGQLRIEQATLDVGGGRRGGTVMTVWVEQGE